MSDKIVDIRIDKAGNINVDQIGFSGSSCSGAINDLLNKLNRERETKKKNEFWKEDKVKVKEFE